MTTEKSSNGTVTTAPEQVPSKRAFVYLRVSS